MELEVNGRIHEVADSPSRMLLWVLRDELGLYGTKYGCGAGICGACTVLMDNEAARACITPLPAAAGKSIRTIEGLADSPVSEGLQMHPVQQAFLDLQVPQCSYCMSGQMMTAVAFLEKTPNPTEEDIVAAMGQNYCRCGCYFRIKQAVSHAAGLVAQNGGAA